MIIIRMGGVYNAVKLYLIDLHSILFFYSHASLLASKLTKMFLLFTCCLALVDNRNFN